MAEITRFDELDIREELLRAELRRELIEIRDKYGDDRRT